MTLPRSLIIVEPWFSAVGHPAQSIVNTARVLAGCELLTYVISRERSRPELDTAAAQLKELGCVREFHVPRASLALGTLLSVRPVVQAARRASGPVDVFYLDAHVLTFALTLRLLRICAPQIGRVSMLALEGPERYAGKRIYRDTVAALLRDADARLFLRTDELAADWRAAFGVAASSIATLPSLEIPAESVVEERERLGPLRFGVIGQVRRGKGLEWLAPLFSAHPEAGVLEIVGSFYSERERDALRVLLAFPGFTERRIPEQELLPLAASFDYIVTLYDEWDPRFEAATLYLAARANRPVVCYAQGWCGRMIHEYGCGIAIAPRIRPSAEFFASLPERESPEYRSLVAGARRFHAAHLGPARRAEFLDKLVGRG